MNGVAGLSAAPLGAPDPEWKPEWSTYQRVQAAPGMADERRWRTAARLSSKNGKRHTMYWGGGKQYTGFWKSNKKHGKGTMVYSCGDKYEGEWAQDVREGQGTLWKALRGGRFRVQYHGQWRDDRPEGRGVFYDDAGDRYEGEWRDGLRHGRGRQEAGGRPGDGHGADVYVGEWAFGKRCGRGTLMLANGDVYEGHWDSDVKHGKGSFFYTQKGKRYDGVWKDGSPVSGALSDMAPDAPSDEPPLPTLELVDPDGVLAQAQRDGQAE